MFRLFSKKQEEIRKENRDLLSVCEEAVGKGSARSAADLILSEYRVGTLPFFEAWDLAKELPYCHDLDELQARFGVTEPPEEHVKTLDCFSAVYGAVYGDIIGSFYEGDLVESVQEALQDPSADYYHPTDDTILTLATLQVVMNREAVLLENRAREKTDFGKTQTYPIRQNPYTSAYRVFADKYPVAGFGSGFVSWHCSGGDKPYGSFGNGSAMRISPIGALYHTQEDVILQAAVSAMATHNHIEGVKGAIVTAMCIYLARHGYSKKQIRSYLIKHYSYGEPLWEKFRYREAVKLRSHPFECLFSVPAAVLSFVESTDFADAINKAACVGYDTDTNACICGGIAGAYYGISREVREVVKEKLAFLG